MFLYQNSVKFPLPYELELRNIMTVRLFMVVNCSFGPCETLNFMSLFKLLLGICIARAI